MFGLNCQIVYLCTIKLILIIKNNNKMVQNQPIRPLLKTLEAGKKVEYPISRLSSLRACTSTLSLELDRKYTVVADRERKLAIVTRTK